MQQEIFQKDKKIACLVTRLLQTLAHQGFSSGDCQMRERNVSPHHTNNAPVMPEASA
jgi:hypothetical protein